MGRPQLYDSNFCFRCKTLEKEKWKKYAEDNEKDLGEIVRLYLNALVVERPSPMPEIRKPREITPTISISSTKSEIDDFINDQLDTFGAISTKDLIARFEKSRRTVNDYLLRYRENVEPLVFDGGQRVWRRIE